MGRLQKKLVAKTGSKLSQHIGDQLLKARRKRDVTMRQVADGAGLSPTFVCDLENGRMSPGAETLWRLSQYFEVPIGYWFKGYTGSE